ncbi:carboxypeptidase M32 [Qiania dongpingensis]|uniref:Metal-dependent carboxypeptidase n=1 Tax=Qiania dongpingensis TaxID=2763669 RepID=A0A7G9G4H1_9FIRM|nr:carboxypeptidase M32 [Qiania dongpingensis]QNM05703.1 carboxypeptidase M32 [Qiania dongpingensis]
MEAKEAEENKGDEFSGFLERWNALQTALTLFDWDNETLAPPEAADRTAKVVGTLSADYQELLVREETGKLLEKEKKKEGLSEIQRAVLKSLEREREKLSVIPPDEYRRFSELTAVSVSKWSQAKKSGDFKIFAPVLSEIVDTRKRFASYRKKEGENLYDILLSDYEERFTMEILDDFFDQVKAEVVPLVKAVTEKSKKEPVESGFLFQTYDIKKQKNWNRWLAAYLGFDFSRGVFAESEHPFTTSLHKDDVRITTHYYEDNLESAIFSTIHETGHAIYEQGNGDEVTQTPVMGGTCGVHESQSRFYENILGRSKAFWEPIYGRLQNQFPDQLKDVSLNQFLRAINRAEPGLIRTEADELTYCLHIIVRYELEKKLIDGSLSVEQLPEEWERLYEEYLGLKPSNPTEGVLQDIHWAMGEFGYFPSYALGNAMASQIYHQMSKELDVESLLKNSGLAQITGYLNQHIHRFGAARNMGEVLQDMTGEPFNPHYYIAYLKHKYSALYGLEQ